MDINDKLLLAILKTVPTEQDKLLFENFDKELELMGVSSGTPRYNFLFDNDLIEINESQFANISAPNSDLRIKMSKSIKYVFLNDKGQIFFWILQAEYLREQFKEIEK